MKYRGKEMIGFLGIGACGSNVCEEAELQGYRTAIMNTSPEDLEAVTTIKNKLLIGTKRGCGKDRNLAKKEVKNYYQDIVNFVKNKFADPDIKLVYVVFSCSGGTGSGMSPIIIDLLAKFITDKKFAAIGIIPDLDESAISQYNTLDCLNELTKLNVPMLLPDNNKIKVRQALSKQQLFDSINKSIIADFNTLFEVRKASKYGNLDNRDLLTILTTPSVMTIGKKNIYEEIESADDLSKRIMLSWDNSIYAPLEYDLNVRRMGFFNTLSEDLSAYIDYSIIEKEIGKPLELFEGHYLPDQVEGEEENVVSIIAGLTFPQTRVKVIQDQLNKIKEDLESIKTTQATTINVGEFDWFNQSRQPEVSSPVSSAEDGSIDLDDLFGNY